MHPVGHRETFEDGGLPIFFVFSPAIGGLKSPGGSHVLLEHPIKPTEINENRKTTALERLVMTHSTCMQSFRVKARETARRCSLLCSGMCPKGTNS